MAPPFKFPHIIDDDDDTDDESKDFVMVDRYDPKGLGRQMKNKNERTDLLTNVDEAETPLCQICTNDLCVSLTQKLQVAEKDSATHSTYFKQFNSNPDEKENIQQLTAQLNEIDAEERELLAELKTIEDQTERMETEIDEAKKRQHSNDDTVKKFRRTKTIERHRLDKAENDHESLSHCIDYLWVRIKSVGLHRTFRMAFDIVTDKSIATVNSFRLGCLPGVEDVEWSEINAGFGQVALMMASLAKRLNMEYNHYEIVPHAHRSYVRLTDAIGFVRVALYATGFEWNTRFDRATTALLDCIGQLETRIQRLDNGFKLPYTLVGATIQSEWGEAYSIT